MIQRHVPIEQVPVYSETALLSLAEYEKIVASGVFNWPNQRRIELIRGELKEMNPIGPSHNDMVDVLTLWSFDNVPRSIRVRVQGALTFAGLATQPQPDVAWVRQKSYSTAHPAAEDVLLVIEVADSSLDRDRKDKRDVYAEVGIQDYWIINLPEQTIEVYRDPASGHYRSVKTFTASEPVAPLATPDISITFDRLMRPDG